MVVRRALFPDSFGVIPHLAPTRAHPPLHPTPCHYMSQDPCPTPTSTAPSPGGGAVTSHVVARGGWGGRRGPCGCQASQRAATLKCVRDRGPHPRATQSPAHHPPDGVCVHKVPAPTCRSVQPQRFGRCRWLWCYRNRFDHPGSPTREHGSSGHRGGYH